ncbi:MAG: dUTP diphosphatase, partial [Angelakisella sp.]
VPTRATDGSAGYDMTAVLDAPVTVCHGAVAKIPTGVAIELPEGYAALILGRSGLGIKYGVVPANGVGLIDSDYRGEICVGLTCQCEAGYTVQSGERIAQMVIVPVATPELEAAESLEDTSRGAGGFGSTGVFAI